MISSITSSIIGSMLNELSCGYSLGLLLLIVDVTEGSVGFADTCIYVLIVKVA